MKTFFKKASVPRQLRKKHFLTEDNSLALLCKISVLHFQVSPMPTKTVEMNGCPESLTHLLDQS